jgi:uncharacterized cupin superfamily protein
MTLAEFRSAPEVPVGLGAPLCALWHDASGNWDAAHVCVQDDDSHEAAWVHAYLHRKEGDSSNAGYWYARAGKPRFQGSLKEEWNEIARILLTE